MKIILLFIITIILSLNISAQDTLVSKYKNIIRWNITPMAVVGPKSLVLGYERIVKPWQSFSINIGYLELAPYTNEDGEAIIFFNESKDGGLSISADYRFYFKKRNKFAAPDGLYWGPYAAYYGLWKDASVKIIDNNVIENTANMNGSFHMISAGVQLGYQFVIKERFTLDLILMGPSLTYYNLDATLDFEGAIDPDKDIYKEIYDKILAESPALASFVKNREFSAGGRLKFLSYGFRYGIQFGYRF